MWRSSDGRQIASIRARHTTHAGYTYLFAVLAVLLVEVLRINSIDPYGGSLFWQVLRLFHYGFVAIFSVAFIAIPIERLLLRVKYKRVHYTLVRVVQLAFVAVLVTGLPLFLTLQMR